MGLIIDEDVLILLNWPKLNINVSFIVRIAIIEMFVDNISLTRGEIERNS